MKSSIAESNNLQVVRDEKCPYCGCAQLIDKGIGYAIGEMTVKWKYQCASPNCKQQFYIRKDLSRY